VRDAGVEPQKQRRILMQGIVGYSRMSMEQRNMPKRNMPKRNMPKRNMLENILKMNTLGRTGMRATSGNQLCWTVRHLLQPPEAPT
jgi:hypothetical protein